MNIIYFHEKIWVFMFRETLSVNFFKAIEIYILLYKSTHFLF